MSKHAESIADMIGYTSILTILGLVGYALAFLFGLS